MNTTPMINIFRFMYSFTLDWCDVEELLNNNPILIKSDRDVIIILKPKFTDQLAAAYPCNIKVGAYRRLDFDPSVNGILNNGVFAVGHGHLERDVGFGVRLIDECYLTKRYCGR